MGCWKSGNSILNRRKDREIGFEKERSGVHSGVPWLGMREATQDARVGFGHPYSEIICL